MQWQPIETAPDDTLLLVVYGGDVLMAFKGKRRKTFEVCGASDGRFLLDEYGEWNPSSVTPTHWMPLPEPPESE